MGVNGPDIYGISFESKSGLYLDNVAMRGNSGTVFRKMDRTLLTEMVQEQNVGLYILQYGGNVVPYLKDSVGVEKYGKWFESQVKLLKQIAPQASILMIGPSDMSERIDGEMTTRPWVVEVNDAMREVAFRNGAAYWDLFQVMGGKNSMVTWVESDPPLAASDYTHFTPRGARQVSELLVQSLEEEQDKWKEAQKKNLKEDDIHAHK